MRISIKKNILENIVNNTSSYLEKKDGSAVTAHILLEARAGVLNIKATDHEIGLFYKISDVNIVDEGTATAGGKRLLDILKGLKDGEVTLLVAGTTLHVKQGRSNFKLPMFETGDFPAFPTIAGKRKFEVDSIHFARNIKKLVNIIATNSPNYAMNGALIDIKSDCIDLVATDGKQLSVLNMPGTNAQADQFILPKKAISEMQKIFYQKVEIWYDNSTMMAICDEFEFFTKLINAKFPAYERVIPKEFDQSLTIGRDSFLDGMKTISRVCEKMNIIITNGKISFESVSDDNSEAKHEMDAEISVKTDIQICITNKHLMDFLNNIENDKFVLNFNNPDSAIMLESGDLRTVVMPTIK